MTRTVLAILVACVAGCSSPDLPPLPTGEKGNAEETPSGIEVRPIDPGALTPGTEGDTILAGVVLLAPTLDAASGFATFSVRNGSGRDLPDLILAVVYAVGPADGQGPLSPRFESIEAPLKSGETRQFHVTLSTLAAGEVPSTFRVVAGVPELLTAPGDGLPGTTFLGGMLECVTLDADLTGVQRMVKVGLAERGMAASQVPLPPIEAQLLLSRAGDIAWSGPWILVPKAGSAGSRERRIQWNLADAPGLAGCDLFLRVREKR